MGLAEGGVVMVRKEHEWGGEDGQNRFRAVQDDSPGCEVSLWIQRRDGCWERVDPSSYGASLLTELLSVTP